uniref:Uncharacterized protein n=1 Tax=Anopheles stephensi TaxID=30069 RepID=A0A182YRG8_ANOST
MALLLPIKPFKYALELLLQIDLLVRSSKVYYTSTINKVVKNVPLKANIIVVQSNVFSRNQCSRKNGYGFPGIKIRRASQGQYPYNRFSIF